MVAAIFCGTGKRARLRPGSGLAAALIFRNACPVAAFPA
jgi:hypothetical protein